MTEKEIDKSRYELVVKSNELIRKSRFSLSVVEQKIVLYLISKIKPDDTSILEYEFDIREFCEVCGIDYRTNLSQLKENIKSLRDKSVWMRMPDKSEVLISWVSKARISYGTGTIQIRLDSDLMPYLLQLKNNFTTYELIAVLGLRSKFSIRLYELFKSYEYKHEYEVSIEELRKMLMINDEYPKMADFKRYVIDKAVDEISRFTDIIIDYEPIKNGKNIVGFRFTIEKDPSFNGRYHATHLFLEGRLPTRYKYNKELTEIIKNNQMSLFEEDIIE